MAKPAQEIQQPKRGVYIRRSARRELVARYIALTGSAAVSEIKRYIKKQTGKSVNHSTIESDVDDIRAESTSWKHDMARTSWMANVRQMYEETNQEIIVMQQLTQKLVDADPQIPDALLKLIEQIDDPDTQDVVVASLKKVYGAARIQKILGKVAYAGQVIQEKRDFLIKLSTEIGRAHV